MNMHNDLPSICSTNLKKKRFTMHGSDAFCFPSADGDYTVTIMTKATVSYDGKVTWQPPAIYKCYCNINVKFFPFDEQNCHLKFGSWSYSGDEVGNRA